MTNHRRTDPACTEHREPRTWWQRRKYDRARGRSCHHVPALVIHDEYEHHALPHEWVHPETGVRIACEAMPPELLPDDPR